MPQQSNWFSTGIGMSNFSIGASYTGDGFFRVEVYIDSGYQEQNKKLFNQLRELEGSIEEGMGEPLSWDELPTRRASRIYIARQGTIDDPSERRQEHITWGAERLSRLKEVFLPILKRIPSE